MGENYIYLVFSKTGTWLARLIRVISQQKYVHTAISFDNDFVKMYSFGRIHPDNPFYGGFVEENLYAGVYQRFSGCECLIYRVRVTPEQYCYLQQLVEDFRQKKDRLRYNFLGLFGVLLNRPIKRENHYFCSQFVAQLLSESKVYNCGKDPGLTRTSDFFTMENKDVFWEGSISDYLQSASKTEFHGLQKC